MQYPDGAKAQSIPGPQVSAAHAAVDFVVSPSKKGRLDAPYVIDSERMVLIFFPFSTRYRGEGQGKCQGKWESERVINP